MKNTVPDYERIKKQIIRHEGKRLFPYQDSVGKTTIGVGRNLDDKGISEEECELMLKNDIRDHWEELIEYLPWVLELDQPRQRVMLNMAFNLGLPPEGKLLTFKNTLALIKNHQFVDAADNMLKSLWARQVGKRAIELADTMRTGRD